MLARLFPMTLLALVAFCDYVSAEQTQYLRKAVGDDARYEYRWLDHDGKARRIAFTLPQKTLQMLPQQQLNYQPALAMREVEVALLKAAQQIDPRVARFSLVKRHDTLSFTLSGKDDAQLEQLTQSLKDTQKATLDTYLEERYYQHYTTPLLQKAVKPNHVRYIAESVFPLIPAAQSIYDIVDEQSNARSYLNLLLSWAQAIPYDTLENRITSNGSGFSPPLAILNQNKGDCDSKAVLAAALIRAFLPGNPMKLVLLHDHALLAISMTPLATDETLMVEGLPYILLDPTGPGQLKLGEVSDSTRQGLASRNYILENIPSSAPQ